MTPELLGCPAVRLTGGCWTGEGWSEVTATTGDVEPTCLIMDSLMSTTGMRE